MDKRHGPLYHNVKYDYEIGDTAASNDIALLGKALSSPTRLQIIRLLGNESLTLSQIADKLDLPLSSASMHIKILEECNLLGTDHSVKRKGSTKFYSFPNFDISITMRLQSNINKRRPASYVRSVKIGDYADASFAENCGIASETELLMENNPHDAFTVNRHDAQLIWSHGYGYLEYAISNEYAFIGILEELNFSLELCSEARGYNHNFPSDITFWINGVELCTFKCPGDYGNRYGKYTPDWWFPDSTKYGVLTTVAVVNEGVYLNGKAVGKHVGLPALNLKDGNRTTLKIGIKDNAVNKGGFNVFGEKFGDYAQDIVFNATYRPD